jgi:hypothetical protein
MLKNLYLEAKSFYHLTRWRLTKDEKHKSLYWRVIDLIY